MNPIRIISILAISLLLTGCDFVRSSLGKPTSEDINRIRMEKVVIEQARADSLARVEARIAAEQDSILAAQEADRIKRFYIVVGSFKVEDNATKLSNQLSNEGYHPRFIDITSGMISVAICGDDDEDAIRSKLEDLKSQQDFRYDTFIYDLENRVIIK